MPAPFELMPYLRAMLGRWKRMALVVAVASAVALAVSLLLPKTYEATATLVIQPAIIQRAGSEARFSAFVNRTYLEYLRSYEHVLQSDGLLDRLIRQTTLDQPPYGYTVASFRSSALNVTLLKNTKILKVRVRLSNPQKAHEVALSLARLAAQSNAEMNSAEAQRATEQFEKEMERLRARLGETQDALEKFHRAGRGDAAPLKLRRQELELNYSLAESALVSYSKRASQAELDMAARQEELLLADSGIVPSHPIGPRLGLNVLLAALLGFLGSFLYETWVWNWAPEQGAGEVRVRSSQENHTHVGVS